MKREIALIFTAVLLSTQIWGEGIAGIISEPNKDKVNSLSEAPPASSEVKTAIEADSFAAVKSITPIEARKVVKTQTATSYSDFSENHGTLLTWLALGVGILGLLLGGVAFLQSPSKKMIEELAKRSVLDSVRMDEKIRGIADKAVSDYFFNKPKPLTKSDIKEEVRAFFDSPVVISSLKERLKIQSPESSKEPYTEPRKPYNISGSQQQPYVLYARDTNSKILNGVSREYLQGKSIYKIILDSPDSGKGFLDLCLERCEVKRRILKNDKQFIEAVCDVRTQVANPEDIVVTEKGVVEKTPDGVWGIAKKISVELI